jgi:hypothetical protein
MVLSFDETAKELRYMRVQQKFVRTAENIYHIRYADGEELETMWSHRFNIAGLGEGERSASRNEKSLREIHDSIPETDV